MWKCWLILLVQLSVVTLSYSSSDWEQFKAKYGKVFKSFDEEILHKERFEVNLKKIREHNKLFLSGLESYSQGVNQFTDMEFQKALPKNRLTIEESGKTSSAKYVSPKDVPNSKDWREVPGVVTSVKKQLHYWYGGWTFAVAGAVEGLWMLFNNVSVSLSAQQLMDCDLQERAHTALMYIELHGIESEESYPYVGEREECKEDKKKVVATIERFDTMEPLDEEAMRVAVGTMGPVVTKIVVPREFRLYSKGIFTAPKDCDLGHISMEHGLLIVGYGEEGGMKYWIVKNSWGVEWGEGGFARVERGVNTCEIAWRSYVPWCKSKTWCPVKSH